MDRRAIIGALIGIVVTTALVLPLLSDNADTSTSVSQAANPAPSQPKPDWDDLTRTDDLGGKKVNVESLMLKRDSVDELATDPQGLKLVDKDLRL